MAANTNKVSNLVFLSPFLSLYFINRFLGEEIYISTYVGLVIIVSGLMIQQLPLGRQEANKSAEI